MGGSMIIIGAGMGGLAAGIYGRMNGFQTRIFESHSLPGGQCASWKRQGYTLDACIHHLFGCSPGSKIYGLWKELGAMPREMVKPAECAAVAAPDGTLFRDYYDLDLLRQHLHELAPGDGRAIEDYIEGISAFSKDDAVGELMLGTRAQRYRAMASLLPRLKWVTPTMETYGTRFKDPFLKKAFPLLVYSNPKIPLFVHLVRHAYANYDALQWPVGGALMFALSIEKRYRELGGEVEYNARVERILVENGRAVGVRLAGGAEHRADVNPF